MKLLKLRMLKLPNRKQSLLPRMVPKKMPKSKNKLSLLPKRRETQKMLK